MPLATIAPSWILKVSAVAADLPTGEILSVEELGESWLDRALLHQRGQQQWQETQGDMHSAQSVAPEADVIDCPRRCYTFRPISRCRPVYSDGEGAEELKKPTSVSRSPPMNRHHSSRIFAAPLVAALLAPAVLAQSGVATRPPVARKMPHETKFTATR